MKGNIMRCEACYGTGQWEAACCDGSGGCSCRGDVVPMGRCNVCHGTGDRDENANLMANVETIRGYGFLGSGPSYDYFGCRRMNKK